jgi:tetratricopeptide (TPR) repeat protein
MIRSLTKIHKPVLSAWQFLRLRAGQSAGIVTKPLWSTIGMKRAIVLFPVVILLLEGCAGKSAGKFDAGDAVGAYGRRAYVHFNGGQFGQALSLYTSAVEQARRLDLPEREATYLFNIGRIYYEGDIMDSAVAAFNEARAVFLICGDSSRAGRTAGFLALASSRNGEGQEARRWLETGLASPSSGDSAFWLTVTALVDWRIDRDAATASMRLGRAADIYEKNRAHHARAQVYWYMAAIETAGKDYDRALDLLDRSLKILDTTPERYRRWRVLLGYAEILFCKGEREKGAYYYQRARDCAPAISAFPSPDTIANCGGWFAAF